jgi:hypothetical protein
LVEGEDGQGGAEGADKAAAGNGEGARLQGSFLILAERVGVSVRGGGRVKWWDASFRSRLGIFALRVRKCAGLGTGNRQINVFGLDADSLGVPILVRRLIFKGVIGAPGSSQWLEMCGRQWIQHSPFKIHAWVCCIDRDFRLNEPGAQLLQDRSAVEPAGSVANGAWTSIGRP